ncbi:hypothetical protein FXV83_00480 [Bradyrhizobium hipponense]|uniref:Uncharacterized protein n=1 Tax=Bradyrhizobium hipponense TaxID=2605638 RepID=A0A5S4YXZ1_9BRAD|nr:hypothetical protein [Bradyrhizobium hipponense]TYO68477.1 hypothetical protein FXV83_00480 [Bradyrhizobium hipponense]
MAINPASALAVNTPRLKPKMKISSPSLLFSMNHSYSTQLKVVFKRTDNLLDENGVVLRQAQADHGPIMAKLEPKANGLQFVRIWTISNFDNGTTYVKQT